LTKSFAHLTLILLLHYLAKFRSRSSAGVYKMNSYWVVQPLTQKIIVRPQNH